MCLSNPVHPFPGGSRISASSNGKAALMQVTRVTCFARAIAIVVAILISSGQFFFIAIQTKAEDAKAKHRWLSNDQKITQLLTRLNQ